MEDACPDDLITKGNDGVVQTVIMCSEVVRFIAGGVKVRTVREKGGRR
jgi:hypothetical protein